MDAAFRAAVASRVGYDPVAIELTTDPARQLLEANFNLLTISEMELYPWHWNERDMEVALETLDAEHDMYGGVVTVPDPIVRIHSVWQNGYTLRYDRLAKLLYLWMIDNEDDPIIIRGQSLCSVAMWPETFREAMVNRCAALIATALMQRASVGEYFDKRAAFALDRLRLADSQQQTTRRMAPSRFARARHTARTTGGSPLG